MVLGTVHSHVEASDLRIFTWITADTSEHFDTLEMSSVMTYFMLAVAFDSFCWLVI